MKIRRVVTGFNEAGASIVTSDDIAPDNVVGPDDSRIGMLWAYRDKIGLAESNALEALPAGKIDSGQLLMKWSTVELGPGCKMPMHATKTVDLVTMLDGEVTLVLDSGVEILLRPHDTLLQRGTVHAWENRSDKPGKWTTVTLGRLTTNS